MQQDMLDSQQSVVCDVYSTLNEEHAKEIRQEARPEASQRERERSKSLKLGQTENFRSFGMWQAVGWSVRRSTTSLSCSAADTMTGHGTFNVYT